MLLPWCQLCCSNMFESYIWKLCDDLHWYSEFQHFDCWINFSCLNYLMISISLRCCRNMTNVGYFNESKFHRIFPSRTAKTWRNFRLTTILPSETWKSPRMSHVKGIQQLATWPTTLAARSQRPTPSKIAAADISSASGIMNSRNRCFLEGVFHSQKTFTYNS